MASLTCAAQLLRSGGLFLLSLGERGGLIYSCNASSSEFRAGDTPMSFTQKPLPARALPCCGRHGDLPPPSSAERTSHRCQDGKNHRCFQTQKPFFRSRRKSLHAKNLFTFKMRLTGLFIPMKWDSVKGTV